MGRPVCSGLEKLLPVGLLRARHVQVALASCNAARVAGKPNRCHSVCTAWQGTAAQVLVGKSA